MLRIKAKQEQHLAILPRFLMWRNIPLLGTTVKLSFLRHREDSPFLMAGGVWWKKTPDGFHFHDGDGD